ncbi:uncharacterized protein LOC134270723 [Saccostrea cucullata]|uniref:uncharacterized protein LOC134270723 n=1 Tax=Saccostrea cuccullata TaxID=36930 RepID=UPI002ED226AE
MDQIPDTAQHFIECDTYSCRNFSKFYCNTCHQRICNFCRTAHLKVNKDHEIVRYQERKTKLPLEKCRIHPAKDIDIYCNFCLDAICSVCFARHHSDHDKNDLENIYNDLLQQCQKEISEIWNTTIPKAKNIVESIGETRYIFKNEIAKSRISMKKRADEIKEVVDCILNNKNKSLDEIENSVLNEMMTEQKKTEDYIYYLEKMIADFEGRMSSIKHSELMKFHLEISLATLKMPFIAKPKFPNLTFCTLNKDELSKQLGEIELDSSERLKLCTVTKVSEITIQENGTYHLSLLPSKKIWNSDMSGNLIQFDKEGNISDKISISSMCYFQANHTVTKEGELLYTDGYENTVYRVTCENAIHKLTNTGDRRPEAIYSSHINGHILVAMEKNKFMAITRYSREGTKLQDIQWDDKRQNLYQSIDYITENINGDICTSDEDASEVVVVTASGEYRFSYSGHHSQPGFCPYGICTDVLGHILVCNGYNPHNENSSSVHLLDINGHFLSFLLTPKQCPEFSCALCIDNEYNFCIGGWGSSTVSVYKYYQETDK